MTRRWWNATENAILRRLAGLKPAREIAELISTTDGCHVRTVEGVHGRSVKLRLASYVRRRKLRPDGLISPVRWTNAERAALRSLAGTIPAKDVPAAMLARTGITRGQGSVRNEACRLKISLEMRGIPAMHIARILPLSGGAIGAMVRSGEIRATRTGEAARSRLIVTDVDLEAYLRAAHPRWHPSQVRAGKWRTLVQALHRSDPWLTPRQAARHLRLAHDSVLKAIYAGRLPGSVRHPYGWRIPASALVGMCRRGQQQRREVA